MTSTLPRGDSTSSVESQSDSPSRSHSLTRSPKQKSTHRQQHRHHHRRRSTPPLDSVSKTKSQSPRIVLGPGALAHLPAELERLSLSSPLIIISPSRLSLAKRIRNLLPNINCYVLDSDTHPVPEVLSGRDCVISVGGASAMAMAREISSSMAIPHVCIPTTRAGSDDESQGEKEDEKKKKILPEVIIYDEKLTASQKRRISAPTEIVAIHPDMADMFTSGKGDTEEWSYLHLPGV